MNNLYKFISLYYYSLNFTNLFIFLISLEVIAILLKKS